MSDDRLQRVAELIAQRNAIDARIAAITGRPVVHGHLGEWIASQVFDIRLETSATAKSIDGRFASGPLAGRTVNVKWYTQRQGLLDMGIDDVLDYYLVMTGPKAAPVSSRGTLKPLGIASVHLFSTVRLIRELRDRGVKIGVATSVRAAQWDAAEIIPRQMNQELPLSEAQRRMLALLELATDAGQA